MKFQCLSLLSQSISELAANLHEFIPWLCNVKALEPSAGGLLGTHQALQAGYTHGNADISPSAFPYASITYDMPASADLHVGAGCFHVLSGPSRASLSRSTGLGLPSMCINSNDMSRAITLAMEASS